MFGKNKKENIELSQFNHIDEVQVDNVDELLSLLEDANSDFENRRARDPQAHGHLFIKMKNKKGKILHQAEVNFPYSDPGRHSYVEEVFSFLFEKPNETIVKIGQPLEKENLAEADIEKPKKVIIQENPADEKATVVQTSEPDNQDEDVMFYEIPREDDVRVIAFTHKDLLQELGVTRAALSKLDKMADQLAADNQESISRSYELAEENENLKDIIQKLKVDLKEQSETSAVELSPGMSKQQMVEKLIKEISEENEVRKRKLADQMKALEEEVAVTDNALESWNKALEGTNTQKAVSTKNLLGE